MATNIKTTLQNNNTVPLLDIFFRTLSYWPWIVLSIVMCVGFGILYLLRTPNVYTETASVLIKDDEKGKSAGASINDFGELGLFQSNTNINNEISSFKSPDLMEEVVKRLDLTMNYLLPGAFHRVVAYGPTLPVKVSVENFPDNGSFSFKLEMNPGGEYRISDLKLNEDIYGKEYQREFLGNLGDTIATEMGNMVITPSSSYNAKKRIEMEVVRSSLKSTINSYELRLGVELDNKQGTVINLSFSDVNIQRADEVLNTLIGVYNENWIRDKNQIAVSTSNFINDRLNVIENELGNVDSDISTYKSENAIPDLNAAASSYLAESQALGQEIVNLNNQLQMNRYIKSYLNSDGTNDRALPANSGIENLNLQNQISEYNAKLLERNAMLAKSSEKNPLVQNMDKELNEMKSAIIGSVDNSIVNIQTQMKGLQGARGAATSKLASNPTQAKYLLSVERQQKVKENLYLFLLQKREDNELNQAFTAYNTRVIKKPGGDGRPTSPRRSLVLAVSFFIGLFLPFGYVYTRETTNTKVRGRKDVENLNIPMLGEIPYDNKIAQSHPNSLKKKSKKKKKDAGSGEPVKALVVHHGSRNTINEAFRVLRTNIEFTRINKDGCNVAAVTSFNPASGKSFITMNLGASLALKKRNVLVIDGDLRHATASSYIGKPDEGLSDYLAGNIRDINTVIVPYPDMEGLEVLPVGSIPPNPTELLENGEFNIMIENLREHYDYILIDCPPIEVVADAQIIDRVADRTIFVLRAGLLERSMLPNLERLYEEKKYNHIAYILNGTHSNEGRYGYKYGYKYGYNYGYGYGYGDGYHSKEEKE